MGIVRAATAVKGQSRALELMLAVWGVRGTLKSKAKRAIEECSLPRRLAVGAGVGRSGLPHGVLPSPAHALLHLGLLVQETQHLRLLSSQRGARWIRNALVATVTRTITGDVTEKSRLLDYKQLTNKHWKLAPDPVLSQSRKTEKKYPESDLFLNKKTSKLPGNKFLCKALLCFHLEHSLHCTALFVRLLWCRTMSCDLVTSCDMTWWFHRTSSWQVTWCYMMSRLLCPWYKGVTWLVTCHCDVFTYMTWFQDVTWHVTWHCDVSTYMALMWGLHITRHMTLWRLHLFGLMSGCHMTLDVFTYMTLISGFYVTCHVTLQHLYFMTSMSGFHVTCRMTLWRPHLHDLDVKVSHDTVTSSLIWPWCQGVTWQRDVTVMWHQYVLNVT